MCLCNSLHVWQLRKATAWRAFIPCNLHSCQGSGLPSHRRDKNCLYESVSCYGTSLTVIKCWIGRAVTCCIPCSSVVLSCTLLWYRLLGLWGGATPGCKFPPPCHSRFAPSWPPAWRATRKSGRTLSRSSWHCAASARTHPPPHLHQRFTPLSSAISLIAQSLAVRFAHWTEFGSSTTPVSL